MNGSSGYVHISRRARSAAAALEQDAARRHRRPAAPAEPGPSIRVDQQLSPHGQGSHACGFVLYVGLDEVHAAEHGTTLVEIVSRLRGQLREIAPEAETYAAVALAQPGAAGSDLEVVRSALSDPTAAARAEAAARTAAAGAHEPAAGVLIDLARREVLLDGEPIGITHKEFELLSHLVENRHRAVGRSELIDSIWADAEERPNERTIDVHIRRLRTKLGRMANTVRTVRGQGYRFYEHPEVAVWAAPEYSI